MPVKGDARPERQSSWPGSVMRLGLRRSRNYVRIVFAGFVVLHLAWQAYRAATDGAVPLPGPEVQPVVVAAVLLIVWLPFSIFAASELARARSKHPAAQARPDALARVEPLALLSVLAFFLLHGAQFAWPLLSGRLLAGDLRPELIATLSSTRSGVPLQAIAALGAVGAGSFYAVRQLRKAWPELSQPLTRAITSLGIAAYLLGSYAVIRCASGSLFP